MNLHQLEYALALQKTRNYSRAASNLGISQPTLSIQIKKLEENLGLTLFHRTPRQVSVTTQGKAFLERAQLVVTQARQLQSFALELQEEVTGDLTIGVIPTLAPYLVPLFINRLNEQFGQLKLHIKEALTEEIVEGIKSGDFDGGIISTPIQSRVQFASMPLFYEGFRLFVSSDHPLYPKDSIDVKSIPLSDIWLLKEGNCFRDQVDNICEIAHQKGGPATLFFFESNSIESLCRIVEYRGGVTFLPELTTLHLSSEREEMIKTLNGPERVREISLIHLPNHSRIHVLDQLAQVIRQSVPKRLLQQNERVMVPINLQL